jgi:hypothetical protein
MIGEASHGTHEFYDVRAEVTKMLIAERGFAAVCLEADFPDAARANLFVRGLNADKDADAALSDFVRFPTWMWRNEVSIGIVINYDRLRYRLFIFFFSENCAAPHSSSHRSPPRSSPRSCATLSPGCASTTTARARLRAPRAAATRPPRARPRASTASTSTRSTRARARSSSSSRGRTPRRPSAPRRATTGECTSVLMNGLRARINCKFQSPSNTLTLTPASCPRAPRNSFDRYGEDAQAYGLATGLAGYPSCADAAARAARDVIAARATLIAHADGVRGEELAFAAACNAAVVRDAESYYRQMFFAVSDDGSLPLHQTAERKRKRTKETCP